MARVSGAGEALVLSAIRSLLGEAEPEGRAWMVDSLDLLWPHAELFVRACIHVAMVDGSYDVAEARVVGEMAHRLGVSSSRLEALERSVFQELRDRAG